MSKIVIIPSCSDYNRGDQALTWVTKKVAEELGFNGEFYMLNSGDEDTSQSEKLGLKNCDPVLKHPSRKSKKKDNIVYDSRLFIEWGVVALFDFLFSLFILTPILRKIYMRIGNSKIRETLKIFTESSAVFVKGGGFLHANKSLTEIYKIYYFLFHIKLAIKMKKPVYIMPNSFGPFPFKLMRNMIRKTLTKCNCVFTRESISNQVLHGIGIDSLLFPDLGFFIEKSGITYNYDNCIIETRKKVGITVRPYRFSSGKDARKLYEKYIETFTHFSIWLWQNNFIPIFIEHTLSSNSHENDGTAINDIISQLSNDTYIYISDKNYNCTDLKAIYSSLDYMIGTRFHSVIFSLSSNIPSIAISYGGNKGSGIMRDIGLEKYELSIFDVEISVIKRIFIDLIENEMNIRKSLIELNKNLHVQYNNMIRYMENRK